MVGRQTRSRSVPSRLGHTPNVVKVVCQNCTAPLEVERGSAFAVCGYCGHTNKVKSAQTLMAEQPRVVTPPPVVTPAPVRAPVVRAPKRRSFNIAGCLPVFFAVAGISVALFNALAGTGVWDRVTELVSPGSNAPTLGTIDLGQPLGAPLRGVTTGERSATGHGGDCRGYLPAAPHVVLRNTVDGIVSLDVADSNVDLVMAVHRADGSWQCDDDGGQGTLPRLQIQLGAGEHRVYVGTYSQNNTAAFSLRTGWQPVDAPIAPEGIAPDATPSLADVALTPSQGGSQLWDGTSMGGVSARDLSPRCRGAIPVVPHLRIRATGGEPVRITTNDGTTDLTMVVRTPSGEYLCDDDSGDGLNPAIITVLEAGSTAVWVGVFRADDSAEFILELDSETGDGLFPGVPAALGEVNLDLTPAPEPHAGELRAELDVRTVSPGCRGWVGHGPDLNLVTTIARRVSVTAEGPADLTLVVRDPNGQLRCDDDSGGGQTPRVTATLTPGISEVWVGRIHRRGPGAFTVSVVPTP